MVTNSNNISKAKNDLSPQIIEHKKTTIRCWQSRSWLWTCAKNVSSFIRLMVSLSWSLDHQCLFYGRHHDLVNRYGMCVTDNHQSYHWIFNKSNTTVAFMEHELPFLSIWVHHGLQWGSCISIYSFLCCVL